MVLAGMVTYLYCDKARDQLPSVLDIRRASVSGRLRSVQTCEPIPSSLEGVSFAVNCGVGASAFGTAVAFKYPACALSPAKQAL